jgi:hypothetical protein
MFGYVIEPNIDVLGGIVEDADPCLRHLKFLPCSYQHPARAARAH